MLDKYDIKNIAKGRLKRDKKFNCIDTLCGVLFYGGFAMLSVSLIIYLGIILPHKSRIISYGNFGLIPILGFVFVIASILIMKFYIYKTINEKISDVEEEVGINLGNRML